MKKRFKHTIALVLVSLVYLMVIPYGVWANDNSPPLTAPLSPAFLEYQSELDSGGITTATTAGYGLGHIPEPLARVESVETNSLPTTTTLPSSYDLRTTGRLNAIRDQGSLGNCWTFASLGSLESTLRPSVAVDLSENNLRWNNGFDYGVDAGGNSAMALAYLARWSGPVSEISDPYGSAKKTGLSAIYHVQEVEYLPKSATVIKAAIIDGGALYTSIYADAFDYPSYYNPNTSALYYTGSATTNHDVVIVGWDDNYNRSQFSTTPPGDGAWIIRNSWGTDWGDNGYFYLSYYDTYAANNVAAFHNAEATSNYNRIYQFDPLGNTSARGYDTGDHSSWGANIFTATASENLTAISTYSLSPNTTAEIQIYTNVSAGNPSSGQLRSTQSTSFANEGYYTVDLNTPINLTASENFAVVIKYTTPQTDYPVPVESPIAGYSSDASAYAGQSYLSADGTNYWYDVGYYDDANVCIKAFTGVQSVTLSGIAITHPADKLIYQIGDALDLTGLQVTGSYSDGSTRVETVTAANITGFNSSQANSSQVLTITVGGKTTSYTVQIKNAKDPVDPTVNCYYRTHVQNVGWQETKSNGEVSGTSGLGYRLEAIQIKVDAPGYDLGIAYSTHVQNVGWQYWCYDGELSGTSGYGLRLEAIEIGLTGNDADMFDVYYRVHAQNFGWMGWGKNGEMAGTSGYGYRLEAIQIEVVPKGTYASSYSNNTEEGAYLELN
ncbi:lectin like domain-containing protein [Acetobacterium woodii]|uniref:Peptidase C1A papain C-terminal domain-containing protein n=1 Tax=Acetobacterium woodii (strain ATCC 29683 / DSM 1030 / JCM 2381 / KCTC 1655 / WB1) TaxID=931626 RepID=H6LIQ0_ACEWD|nr:lectin like domain-containing protein [Acetobacterium woodii]AFA48624.1 hypothetical protein Awo_c18450 [Acetobacterium woodii DSM 1030]